MAAATTDSILVSAAPQSPAQTQPRKRRRRAPTTGASEDCHTCRKRGTQCDRRRPYCSQCLEIGKECSGYRTTLTWGVGVASRGKLRGKSLPVVNMVAPVSPVKPEQSPTSTIQRQNSTASVGATNDSNATDGPRKRLRTDSYAANGHGMPPIQPSLPSPPYTIPDNELRPDQREWYQAHQQQPHQHAPRRPTYDTPRYTPPLYADSRHGSVQPMPPGFSNQSSPLVDGPRQPFPQVPYDDRNYNPPAQHMQNSESAPHFIDPFLAPYQAHQSAHHSHTVQFDDRGSNRPDTFAPGLNQWNPHHLNPQSWQNHSVPVSASSPKLLHQTTYGRNDMTNETQGFHPDSDTFKIEELDDDDVIADVVATADYANSEVAAARHSPISIFNAQNLYQITPRMQYLLDYYDKAICSVLVAFDGTTNPYRAHILPLAYQSQGLQHALAALATNNIRMRKVKDIPRLRNESDSSFEQLAASVGKPSPEEQYYKGMSIESLNSQLADAAKARDDSVLATLLILCLFHVCDSGFSKFKTQLAGVQKLLKLRGSNGLESQFIGWIEMFFAWFDVMTSAVNDRELQIQTDSLDLMNLSNNLGALEQFSGCDGRLFKLIARLGRLNLLSQGRPVRGLGYEAGLSRRSSGESKKRDFYSMDFDEEEIVAASASPDETSASAPDGRHAFWHEWREIRERLETLDLDRYSPGLPGQGELPAPQRDMVHISESFRFSALLYTERLAHPSSPSSSANLQNWVEKALHHIQEIGENSCVLKFMLWPLFITGTECVKEEHRELIRNMCIEIQKESGFYNNVSGLEVLEKVWKEADEDGGEGKGCAAQAFAWRRAMDKADGEYIVI